MNRHDHEWMFEGHTDGSSKKTCRLCGERWIRSDEDSAPIKTVEHHHQWERVNPDTEVCTVCNFRRHVAATAGKIILNEMTLRGGRTFLNDETVGDEGGVVDYDSATQMITLANGTKVTREALWAANPDMTTQERVKAHRELSRIEESKLSKAKTDPASLALKEAARKIAGISSAFDQLGGSVSGNRDDRSSPYARGYEAGMIAGQQHAPKLGVDDALTLIVETIRHSDDPFTTGGEWLAKVSTAISKVIRDAEE